jgi:hypothetical protein
MAKQNKTSKRKKVVVQTSEKSKLQPTVSKSAAATAGGYKAMGDDLLFGKRNFLFIVGAFALVMLGMLLMAGGKQLPTEWNENEIYSFRRTVIAPIVILSGLAVGVYAIFTKK